MRKWVVGIGIVGLVVLGLCVGLILLLPSLLQSVEKSTYGCDVVSSGVADQFTDTGEWVSGEYFVECADGRRIVTATEGPHDLDPFKTELAP